VDATPSVDATPARDARDARVDAGCGAGAQACTCTRVPGEGRASCWHSFGGLYADGACSAAYQCCNGRWRQGLEQCGPCRCTEPTGQVGCVPEEAGDEVCFPTFSGTAEPLPPEVREGMTGVSWRPGCPVALDELALLRLDHWGLDGVVHRGELVVAAEVADEVLGAFSRIYAARFPIDRMERVDAYDGSDDRSMAANNTSAFNCRPITGGGGWSEHSYGTAIDVNPVQNPYVRGDTVLPPAGERYLDRSDVRPGMVVDPGPVTGAFRSLGWGWGGEWQTPRDYQHFSESGR